MSERRQGLGALVLALVMLFAPAHSYAHDHAVPRTALRYAGQRAHVGYLHQSCWVTQVDGKTALTECQDSVWRFPSAKRVATGRRVVIRIRKASRPTDFAVEAWPRRGDEISGPRGRSQSLPFVLRPRTVAGEVVAWNVDFQVDQSDRHYFIRAGGIWMDEQGSGQNQDAFWLFHIRT